MPRPPEAKRGRKRERTPSEDSRKDSRDSSCSSFGDVDYDSIILKIENHKKWGAVIRDKELLASRVIPEDIEWVREIWKSKG
jgi:hypothetical protein